MNKLGIEYKLGLAATASGGGGTVYIDGEVANYSTLPAAAAHTGHFYLVQNAEGLYLINRKPAGLYYCNGVTWTPAPNIIPFFSDANIAIYNDGDNTKLIAFSAASITTGNTRTITMADANVDLADIGLNNTHRTSSGADHTYIDQSVVSGASPTFAGTNISGVLKATDFTGDDYILVGTGAGTYAAETGATARASLGLTIGTHVLAQQTIGISNDNLLEVDGSPNSGEYARFTAAGLEGRTESEFKADFNLEIGTDVLAQQAIGISDNNLVEIDSASVASGEIARFTANGLESRSDAEMKTQLGYMTDLTDDTSPQLAGDLDAQGNHIGFTQQTITYDSGTTTIDWGAGNKASLTFGAGNITTLAFTNPPKPSNLLLKIIQDGTGGRTITNWDSDVKWPSGTAPTLSAGSNAVDIATFYFDGTNYYGVASLNFS